MEQQQIEKMEVGDKIEFGCGYWGDGQREKFQLISDFAKSKEPNWQFQINSAALGSKFSYELERIK